jgi:hypothetical protein
MGPGDPEQEALAFKLHSYIKLYDVMKNLYLPLFLVAFGLHVRAQVGIGTVSPNSTLDLRGSFAPISRSFSATTSLTANDHTLVFTGSSAATATLPDATVCAGRIYCIKNFSPTLPAPILTIGTVSSQKIDGLASWLLNQSNQALMLISDGANWVVFDQFLPTASGSYWNLGGNSVAAVNTFGTTTAYDLPFITNNTEKMRITSSGNVGIGSTSFAANPEALLVYQNSASSFNVISGKGSLNNYLQLNVQNLNSGGSASSDIVATADNGNEIVNYVDMGINSSTYATGTVTGGINNAYLYSAGNDFIIGNSTAAKNLVFFTGGTATANERMRIDGSGNVGIGMTSPSYKLQVSSAANPLFLSGVQTGANTDSILTIINGIVRKLNPAALVTSSSNAWSLIGNAGTNPASNFIGTTDAQAFLFKENNQQVGRFEQNSIALGLGSTTANSTNCYALGSGANIGFNKVSAFAIGTNAGVSNDSAFAIGTASASSGQNAFSIGSGSQANSANSFAIGRNAYVGYSIASAIAIGNDAVANSANAITIGTGATAGFSLTNPVAIGDGVIVNGSNGVAIGNGANISFVANATALGAGASVTGTSSTAIGYNASATLPNELILGDRSNTSLSVGIGTQTFSGTNREKFLVDAGTTGSVNAIVGRGSIDSYLQLNIQNQSSGVSASSDVVATANNGNETSNYVDMGINGGSYTGGIMGAANDAYLYNLGQNFLIGTGAASKSLIFMTGGTTQSTNERMRIDGSGNCGIGTNAPVQKLDVNGNFRLNGAFMPGNTAGLTGNVLISSGPGVAPVWFDETTYLAANSWILGGNNVSSLQNIGTTSNFSLPIITNNVERMRLDNLGNVAIGGTTAAGATNAEKLLVNAGATTSPNLISAKGSINNYLQMNIQNTSGAGLASADLVATNDAGSYVDLGINSSGYVVNSSPILSGIGNSYLYSTGNDFIIGDSTVGKNVIFFTGGAALNNERMRITGAGNVGINSNAPASTLQVGGSLGLPVTTKTAGYTVAAGDYTILCNNTSGAITISLPTASSIAGRIYVIKKISGVGNNVLVDGFGGETIDGSATNTITTQYSKITIQSDGVNWFIL